MTVVKIEYGLREVAWHIVSALDGRWRGPYRRDHTHIEMLISGNDWMQPIGNPYVGSGLPEERGKFWISNPKSSNEGYIFDLDQIRAVATSRIEALDIEDANLTVEYRSKSVALYRCKLISKN